MHYKIIFFLIFFIFFFNGCFFLDNKNHLFNTNQIIYSKLKYIDKILLFNIPINISSGILSFLGAELWLTNNITRYTSTILIVPGSGNVSRKNSQEGDGIYQYTSPININFLLANFLCKEGFNVLIYDKRSCSPSNDFICNLNYFDLDKNNGFDSLVNDFNIVYEYLNNYLPENQKNKIIAWGNNQATHVILNSKYKNNFLGIVLISPIPDSIDKIIVNGLIEQSYLIDNNILKYKLYNRSETINSIFNSIKNNEFSSDSIILGIKIDFWKKWILETSRSDFLFNTLDIPLILVLGSEDNIYDKYAKNKINRLSIGKNRKFLYIENSDHNLLTNQKLVYRNIYVILKNLLKLYF